MSINLSQGDKHFALLAVRPAGSAQRSQRRHWATVIGLKLPVASGRTCSGTPAAFPAGSLDVDRRDQVEMMALLPFSAVVFTVGGPVVYEWTKNISAHSHETQD